jgi:hypothetical protein
MAAQEKEVVIELLEMVILSCTVSVLSPGYSREVYHAVVLIMLA